MSVSPLREHVIETGAETADVLIVDGSRSDADRARMELHRAGVAREIRIATNHAELQTALTAFAPDIVVADVSLADLDGRAIARIVHEIRPGAPIIFTSASTSDDVATLIARTGAVDYVPKTALFRLPRAVRAALREEREQRALQTSLRDHDAARRHAERLESIWRIVNDPELARNELPALLAETVASIGRGLPHVGYLIHIEPGAIVVDAVAECGGARPLMQAGSRHPPGVACVLHTGAAPRTTAWDDAEADPTAPEIVRTAGLRRAIATLFRAAGTGYALILGSPEAASQTPYGPDDVAFLEVVSSIVARGLEDRAHDDSLRRIESHAQNHRRRLDTLWRMISNTDLRGEALFTAMLEEAAGAVRAGQTFGGSLGHIEGEEFVLDAFWVQPFASAAAAFRTGMRIPLSETIHVSDLAAGRTQSWEDCQTLPNLPRRAREAGLRSQIMTQFRANGSTYVLTLGSLEPPAGAPFSTQDFEYIEVLGSMFARELEMDAIGSSLRDAQARRRRHAERLDAFWRIANDPNRRGQELIDAVLSEAATAMQSGLPCVGVLRHLEETHYVIDNVFGTHWPADGTAKRLLAPGTRIPIAETNPHWIGPGRTQSWEDMQRLPDLPERLREVGWRRAIATAFNVAGTTYELTLGSIEDSSHGPWTAEDIEYCEVIASVLARQFDLERAQHSLSDAEIRVRRNAERLEALWRVASNPTLGGHELVLAMLQHGAAAIRPGQHFRGVLSRFDGDEAVIVGVGSAPGNTAKLPPSLRIGARRSTVKSLISAGAKTQYWDDVSTLGADLPKGLAALRWRAVIATTFDAGNARYSLVFGSTELPSAPFETADAGYIEVLASSFAGRLYVDTLEDSLREAEARSREHAERLETLWQIINGSNLRDLDLVEAMLKQAAAAIQPGQDFEAILLRIRDDDVVIEAVTAPLDSGLQERHVKVGDVVPLATTAVGRVLAEGGGTRSWDDIETSAYSMPATRERGTRSCVITTFTAGIATWALSFTSTRTARRPFSRQDHAYVEVLASFFANHLQQRWQFDRIQYQQTHDVLTGLLNRSTWRSQARTVARAVERYAVIIIDVDGLHEVNETFGHITGDAVLVEIGNALRQSAREGELVGRLGGDVFGIFLPDPASDEHLFARVHAFGAVFDRPFSTGDRDGKQFIARTACIGVAAAPADGRQFESILSRADAALFTAQERGHSSTVFYVAGMEAEAQRRATLQNELRDAIDLQQFALSFQPHVDLASGSVTGCEALIRWNHPERGVVMPAQFIPFAEETGMIASIDAWVMQNAFLAASELAEQRPDFRLYFNLSGRQSGDPNVVRAFVAAARNGLNLKSIGVEITESDAMRDVDATRHVCRALRRLNVRIAIDDFGTGYSSLSSLKRLPVDIVKIDRTFVSGVLSDPHDAIITETIISIGRQFGFETLAEGAEKSEELDWLRERNCGYVQGYAICHPLPLVEFKAWLDAQTA